jgi:hypothetical protein
MAAGLYPLFRGKQEKGQSLAVSITKWNVVTATDADVEFVIAIP